MWYCSFVLLTVNYIYIHVSYSVSDTYLSQALLFLHTPPLCSPPHISTLFFMGYVSLPLFPLYRRMRVRGVQCAVQGYTASKEVADLGLEPRCLDPRVCALNHCLPAP